MELFDGGHATHHVLEAGFVGPVVGYILNGRGTAGALFHSVCQCLDGDFLGVADVDDLANRDRKSTRLNSSHSQISYAVFCLKKKKQKADKCQLKRSADCLLAQPHTTPRSL